MADLPFFKFYPSDWLGSIKLRGVSLAAKGVWIDLLAIMWGCHPRGTLTVSGRAMTVRDAATMLHGNPKQNAKLIEELLEGQVLSRRPDGLMYSERLVKEWNIYQIRADAGAKGGAKSRDFAQAKPQANGEQTDSKEASKETSKVEASEARYQKSGFKGQAAPEPPSNEIAPDLTGAERSQIRQGLIRLGVESGAAQEVSLHPHLTSKLVVSQMAAVKKDKTIKSQAAVLLTRLRRELEMSE